VLLNGFLQEQVGATERKVARKAEEKTLLATGSLERLGKVDFR